MPTLLAATVGVLLGLLAPITVGAQPTDPPESAAIVSAILSRDWYALAALGVWVAVYVARARGLLERVPEGWRWAVPVALGITSAFVSAWSAGLPLATALEAAAQDGLTVALLAMGAHAALRDSPIPYGGAAGGKPE